MNELLPCPFCGGEAGTFYWRGEWWISCENEGCPVMVETLEGTSEAEAIAAWNTRAECKCRDVCASISEFTCSACKFRCDLTSWETLFDGDTGKHRHHHHGTPNYCPNCGAKVRED